MDCRVKPGNDEEGILRVSVDCRVKPGNDDLTFSLS
jgi:hypothetical protein